MMISYFCNRREFLILLAEFEADSLMAAKGNIVFIL